MQNAFVSGLMVSAVYPSPGLKCCKTSLSSGDEPFRASVVASVREGECQLCRQATWEGEG
jgi:hypothetical protein